MCAAEVKIFLSCGFAGGAFHMKRAGITLYGGGLGSGVRMSICGAEKMAEGGRTAEEILTEWFEGVRMEKIR